MTVRARISMAAGGLCLLLACDGGTSPVLGPGGARSTLGQAGDGGARAAAASGAGTASTARRALGDSDTGSGGGGSGNQGFGGDEGSAGRAGTGGSGAGSDDDDSPSADGQQRYADAQNDPWRTTEQCLGASICYVTRNTRVHTER